MRGIRRLLVALDVDRSGRRLTPGSSSAADQALDLARRLASEVVVFHSTASDEAWDSEEQAYVMVPEATPSQRRPVLDEVADRFRAAGISTTIATSAETAWAAIIRRVLVDRIDLVVAGKRAERGRAGFGSVSTKLLRQCPCAVWSAMPGGRIAPRLVLAASDLSPVGEQVIEYAVFVASHYHAALHVVHAFQMPLVVQMEGDARMAAFERDEREERIGKLAAQVARAEEAPEPVFHVACTSPARAVLECNARLDPDLVVMGTVSRGGVPGFLVGNTAERLLGRLDCSLLTVKPADFVCPTAPAP